MSPPTVSKADTSYPIFAATFDQRHNLIVGGGGGAGRHGVGNKITSFDFSSRAPTVEPTAEIELSRDEDSVTCLENLSTKDGVILFAGVNSSEEQRLKDKNEHFRCFEVAFPKSNRRASSGSADRKPQGKVNLISKTSLFNPPASTNGKKEGYQRLLRLSPPKRSASGNKRIGAIASSLAGDENEIVVFNATTTKPQVPGDIISRIELHKGHEANDLDIIEPEDGQFKLAYCTDQDVYVQDIPYDFGKKKVQGKLEKPEKKYTVPFPDVFEKKGRFKIRCIRWLSPQHLLLLANLPNRTGVELQILRLYGDTMGSVTLRKRLPRNVKAAVDMDVAMLDADGEGSYQVVVAVGGIDISLSVFTIDYNGKSQSLSRLHPYATYKEVHPLQITKVIFSPFFSPWSGIQASSGKKPGPQYLQLASTSLGNSISVETFTLQSISSRPRARYILASASSRRMTLAATYTVAGFVVLAIAILVQSMLFPETAITNAIPGPRFKAPGEMMDDARFAAARNIPSEIKTPAKKAEQRIRDFLHIHSSPDSATRSTKALVIHHDPEQEELSTEVHDSHEEVLRRHKENVKKYDELSHPEREYWKKKLTDAGMWAVEEGETILKSIFFGQAGGLIGQMVNG
ncbi:hypothetical protein BDV96DRAFT_646166 [Lophiotrema nucula]|uniref:Guanine nucleotide-exchange factor SEC12 n=1 Tax=Lophiotrema nucula TaxID=690887 RepID=A0A6A5ZC52_9PLEO|nr:hypothetical protein BDV96DRAFT_646166 [Lophiotrema nucula]